MKPDSRVLALVLLVATMATAQTPFATQDDVEKLQLDLTHLESTLTSIDTLPAELSSRVETIREEAIYIKVTMRKYERADAESTGVPRDDVRNLRLDIADLQHDLAPYVSSETAEPDHATLAAGTELAIRLEDTLSSRTAQPGDDFTGTLAEPVLDGNTIALAAGTLFLGRVELVDQASGRTDRNAKLVLGVDRLEADGETYSITATVIRASERLETGVGSEVKKIGIGAGIGTVLGAVLGGKKGAAIGAAVGGGGRHSRDGR